AAVNGDFANLPVDRPRVAEWAFVHSALFRLLSLRFDLLHFRLETDPLYLSKRESAATEQGAPLDVSLRALAELSRQYGFRSLIALWPSFDQDAILDESPACRGTRQQVEEVARRYGLAVFPLRGAFEDDYRNRPHERGARDTYTHDGMHPNPLGAWIAAQ